MAIMKSHGRMIDMARRGDSNKLRNKDQDRKDIANQVDEFLKQGGRIVPVNKRKKTNVNN